MLRAIWLPAFFLGLSFVAALFHWVFVIAVIAFIADVWGRTTDYNNLMELTPSQRQRLLGLYGKTACGRQVMIAAHGMQAYAFYYARGYRPYHLLPDGIFTKNSPFLRLAFWTGLAHGHGVKTK